jgi:hypothetical protein
VSAAREPAIGGREAVRTATLRGYVVTYETAPGRAAFHVRRRPGSFRAVRRLGVIVLWPTLLAGIVILGLAGPGAQEAGESDGGRVAFLLLWCAPLAFVFYVCLPTLLVRAVGEESCTVEPGSMTLRRRAWWVARELRRTFDESDVIVLANRPRSWILLWYESRLCFHRIGETGAISVANARGASTSAFGLGIGDDDARALLLAVGGAAGGEDGDVLLRLVPRPP